MVRVARTGMRIALGGVLAALAAPAAPAFAAPVVTVGEIGASLDTFQALNSNVTNSLDKNDDSFFRFTENLLPPTLTGGEGKADTFAQQATTVVTSAQPPFPVAPVNGISLSGRVRSTANKANNALPGVPVADSTGSMSAEFATSASTPFQFSGALLATNEDPNDCTLITVKLSGPVSRSFAAQQGGDCSTSGLPNTPAFVVTGALPAGSYALSVDYEAEVNPENPGNSFSSLGEVEVNLQFLPPNTSAVHAKISSKHHQATFRFGTTGRTKGTQCALARGKTALKFKSCTSPKTYRHLKAGRYTFEARAIGLAGPDATPAIRKFRIK
jgi:hypothetical protein